MARSSSSQVDRTEQSPSQSNEEEAVSIARTEYEGSQRNAIEFVNKEGLKKKGTRSNRTEGSIDRSNKNCPEDREQASRQEHRREDPSGFVGLCRIQRRVLRGIGVLVHFAARS